MYIPMYTEADNVSAVSSSMRLRILHCDVATSISFSEGSAAQVLDSTITVIDTRGENMESATITISNGYVSGEDVLAFTNANGITGVWDSGSGTLTLSGNATTAASQR